MSTEANGSPIFKRTATPRRRPGPQPPAASREEIFLRLYTAALQGCCSQFEQRMLPNGKPYFTEGDGELSHARRLSMRAWNVATYGCQLFERDAAVSAFDESDGAIVCSAAAVDEVVVPVPSEIRQEGESGIGTQTKGRQGRAS